MEEEINVILNKLRVVRNRYDLIIDNLEKHELENGIRKKNSLYDRVNDYCRNVAEMDKNTMLKHLASMAQSQYNYTGLSIDYFEKEENILRWNILKLNMERSAERTNYWKLWYQRLARWCIGGFVVVALYSVLVSLSEKWDFIKIPVKDSINEIIKN